MVDLAERLRFAAEGVRVHGLGDLEDPRLPGVDVLDAPGGGGGAAAEHADEAVRVAQHHAGFEVGRSAPGRAVEVLLDQVGDLAGRGARLRVVREQALKGVGHHGRNGLVAHR